VGILAAMAGELEAVLGDFETQPSAEPVAGRSFHRGVLHGHTAVAVIAGIGKTAVATTTTLLIDRYGVERIVLLGAAGRVCAELSLGDVVVATELVHHDLDARPIFPRYHVPTLGASRLATDAALSALALAAAEAFIAEDHGNAARVRSGLVLSGDRFMDRPAIDELRWRFPDGLAVEMEGAAVAQVCLEAGTPCAIVRSISDDGDADAFRTFLAGECGRYASGILSRLLASIA
jgi:adenosylhomocysteine nucleosidase